MRAIGARQGQARKSPTGYVAAQHSGMSGLWLVFSGGAAVGFNLARRTVAKYCETIGICAAAQGKEAGDYVIRLLTNCRGG